MFVVCCTAIRDTLVPSGAYDAGTHAPSGALALRATCGGRRRHRRFLLFSPGTSSLFTFPAGRCDCGRSPESHLPRGAEPMKIALVAEEASALSHPMGSEPASQET